MAVTHQDGASLFGRYENATTDDTSFDPSHLDYQLQAAKWGWWMAKTKLSEAYETDGDDSEAIEYIENLAVPLFHNHLGFDNETDPDLDAWADRAYKDFKDETYFQWGRAHPRFRIHLVEDDVYTAFHQRITDAFQPDTFDHVIGVYSSGMPLLYTATEHLNGAPVILRYSHRREQDTEVTITDEMNDRLDVDGADILVAEDHMFQGITMGRVGQYLLDQGAASVHAIFAEEGQATDQSFQHNPGEIIEITDGTLHDEPHIHVGPYYAFSEETLRSDEPINIEEPPTSAFGIGF